MTYSEVEILEYVENNMTEKRRIAFEREMQKDAELKQLVKVMKASVLPYEAAISDQEQDEMPQSIIEFFDDVSRIAHDGHEAKAEPSVYPTQRFGGVAIAASFAMLFFLMGIVTTMVFQPTIEEEYSSFANYDVPSELFESMIIYQALYSRKTVEEASQLPSDTQRLVKEFNVENNTEMRVPDLSSQGYEFRRVQQLAFSGKPILQFIYLAQDGEPVAVCVTPANLKDSNSSDNYMATQFEGMNTVVWAHDKNAYMLISKESKNILNTLADTIRADQS